MAKPVVIVESGGLPCTHVVQSEDPLVAPALPMTPVNSLGMPITLVATGGKPVTLINADGTPWEEE